MNERAITTVVVVSLAVIVGATPLVLDSYLLETHENDFSMNGTIYMPENINDTTIRGDFDPKLSYGEIPAGLISEKSLDLSTDRPTLTAFSIEGNMSEAVDHPRYFYQEGSEEVEFAFNSTEPGYYEGELQMKTWRAEEGVGGRWLGVRYWYYSLRY